MRGSQNEESAPFRFKPLFEHASSLLKLDTLDSTLTFSVATGRIAKLCISRVK